MKKGQRSSWERSVQFNNDQGNVSKSSQSNFRQGSLNSTHNDWFNHFDDIEQNQSQNNNRLRLTPNWRSWCFQGFLLGCLTAGLILAIVIALWMTSGTSSTTATTAAQTMNLINTSNSSSNVTTLASSTSTTSATPTCATWLWNTTGVTVAGVSGTAGSASNQLNSPWNIYVDPTTNYLYIADSQNHRIQRWLPGASSGTTVAGVTGSAGSAANLLNTPKDVFVDSSQNIYVADSANQRIQYFLNGSTTGITVSSSWSWFTIGNLWGVQVLSGSIYACDNTQSTVWNNGSVAAGHNGAGSSTNQLNQPQGFAVDTSVTPGTLYIANSQQHTIVQWAVSASTGTVVAGVSGTNGNGPTLLKYPVSLKLDNYTNMFVVDNNNHRIQLFCRYPTVNLTGRTIAGTGSLGTTAQTFQYPAGVALDASLNLYVSDTSNHRIQKFQRLQ